MPLHLLGKKSWNVYNADNIARVRRDEAAAKAKEEAEEQRMQEVDAERRLAILRGEEPPPLPPTEETPDDEPRRRDRDAGSFGRERKKRKRAGEDDTDFELRVARERSGVVQTANETLRKSTSSAPIVDAAGHIDLFGEERKQGRHLKNEEAEKEAAKKKKEMEDQYTMRLSNAAGKDGMVGPWYAASGSRAELAELEPAGKDAFGNEDPGRKKRDEQRIVANDPLAMMKMGASRLSVRKNLSSCAKRRSERRDMSGGDESTGGTKNATLEIGLVKRMMVKPDPDRGGTKNAILGPVETTSAVGAEIVIKKREVTDTEEGTKSIGDPEEMKGAAMKEKVKRSTNEANETLIHDNEMTTDGQENLKSQTSFNNSSKNDISIYKRRAENS
ncbi:blastn match against entry EMBL [Colletotrichum scovillei]|uniref:Blastn match against entry EMBL n=1 Tax=Colletotrichum scovillei TaxID=1209932 RepID=A0A9P7UK45_9PEZI|nr:blastn match against entry EMBL [Colletotrichum scovillei]KAG7071586.1 blastn match against entry EMBL [Colletotrichum scovillei]KAG7079838.1 blastn match against entry EMBL [Colletotrichum scovillei]